MRDMDMLESAPESQQRVFTVDDYHRIADTGLFANERVELLDGVIVRMTPLGIPHWSRHRSAVAYLCAALGERAQVHGQISLPLGEHNEPEPDIAVVANVPYEDRGTTPEPEEIYALIELAESSVRRDTIDKRSLYAKFAIADYVVIDLAQDTLVHFSRPRNGDYTSAKRLSRGESMVFAVLPDLILQSDGFLKADTPTPG